MRGCIYARYSSDLQSPASIADQVRKCREGAERVPCSVSEDLIITDAEVSGAGSDRPGFQRLLGLIHSRPRPFDVLLVDDTSRISRRQADQSNFVDQLRFAGIRFIAVSQGIDSAHEQADVLMTVHGLVDSLYIKELAKKTHRGLEGKILEGLHAGGRCYGYQNEPVQPSGSRRVIDPKQAKIVVRIFEMYAAGFSYRNIAKALNAESVATARPRAGRAYASWCPTAIREMLRNELYIGRIVWNRRQYIKRPGTNKRVAREHPRNSWKIVDRPELRIVSDELWQQVQNRLKLMKTIYGPSGSGLNKASSSPNLLTGLLKCGTCGANMTVVMGAWGKWGHAYYGCPQNYHRGACSNRLRIRQEVIERNLFSRLQTEVLTEGVIDYTVAEFVRQVRTREASGSDSTAAKRARQRQIERELKRFADAIAAGGHSQFLLEEFRKREQELEQLSRETQAIGRLRVDLDPGEIRKFVIEGLSHLLGLIKTNVARARAELAKCTNEIRLIPEKHENGTMVYYAEGIWDLLGTYRLTVPRHR